MNNVEKRLKDLEHFRDSIYFMVMEAGRSNFISKWEIQVLLKELDVKEKELKKGDNKKIGVDNRTI